MVRRTLMLLVLLSVTGCASTELVPAPPPVTTTAPPLPPPDTSSAAPPSTSAAAPAVSVVGVGDLIMGNTPDLPPDGARGFFDKVLPALRGDVVSGNVEAAITEASETSKCEPDAEDCFAFRFPPGYAKILRSAGFGVLNLANNHSHDYGERGLSDAQSAMRTNGIQPTGLPDQIAVVTVRGVRVAVLGFAPYGWAADLLDIPTAQALVKAARKQADVVVVNMHAGAEGADMTHVRPGHELFLGEDRGDPIAFAHAVVDAGASLVIGHGPHVLRGMEWYHRRLIAYSLGNFAGYHTLSSAGPLGVAGVLRASVDRTGAVLSGSLVPTRMVDRGYPAPDADRTAIDTVNQLSAADFPSCGVRLSASGVLDAPRC
jgi:capsule synthesis protein PGA_cap